MLCPHCVRPTHVIKKGLFLRKNHEVAVSQRYFCFACRRGFSSGTGTLTYRQHRPKINRHIFQLLVSGTSQRRAARLIKTTQTTVALKLEVFAKFARRHQKDFLGKMPPVSNVVFDDMETFEHSKCKPVSIAIAVEEGTRYLIAAAAAPMPAKGRLTHIARKRYGIRRDKRHWALGKVLKTVAEVRAVDLLLKSDKCPRYPKVVRRWLPNARHEVHLSRRACVVGQGELKAGGFDPLFSLNHTCAMFRDNIKRLSRRTWCTTKRVDRLQCFLDLYICYHNAWIEQLWEQKSGLEGDFGRLLLPVAAA